MIGSTERFFKLPLRFFVATSSECVELLSVTERSSEEDDGEFVDTFFTLVVVM